jgi:hypothetical protein
MVDVYPLCTDAKLEPATPTYALHTPAGPASATHRDTAPCAGAREVEIVEDEYVVTVGYAHRCALKIDGMKNGQCQKGRP